MPRPSLLTGSVAAAIARAVEAGLNEQSAGLILGVQPNTVRLWESYGRQDYDELIGHRGATSRRTWLRCVSFARRLDRARAVLEQTAVRRIHGLIDSADRDNVSLNAALGLLERHEHLRQRWSRQQQVVHSGTVQHQAVAIQLTAAEARELYEHVRSQRLAASLPPAQPAEPL